MFRSAKGGGRRLRDEACSESLTRKACGEQSDVISQVLSSAPPGQITVDAIGAAVPTLLAGVHRQRSRPIGPVRLRSGINHRFSGTARAVRYGKTGGLAPAATP